MSWNTTMVLAEGLEQSELASVTGLRPARRTTTWEAATSVMAEQVAAGQVGHWLVVTDPQNTLWDVLPELSDGRHLILAVFGGTADSWCPGWTASLGT